MNPGEADAIPTDAAAEPETVEQPASSPRNEMINHIIDQREQMQQEESNASEPNTEPEALTVKVDGIEQQIPIDQARATIQKNMAADKRLNDAALKQQQLQEWEQRLAVREQQLQQAPPPSMEGDIQVKLQAAVDALYDGDTDDAVKALSEVIGGRTSATLNPDEISKKATEQVMQTLAKREFNAERDRGVEQFKSDYADIASDPHLWDMTDLKTVELMTQHPEWSPTQIINEAGRQTRQWVQQLSGQSPTPNRAERKSQLQTLPRSTGSVAYQPPARNTEPSTPQQVIADMKQARGQV